MIDSHIAIISCLAGFAAGGLLIFLSMRSRIATIKVENEVAREAIDSTRNERSELETKLAVAEALLAETRAKIEEQSTLLDETRARLSTEFENLANNLFDKKAEQNQAAILTLLKPMQERIVEFQQQVSTAYETEGRERFSLAKEVQRLADLNQQVSKDAEALTKALKGDNKASGDWGEVILERVLESSGLRNGAEYETQSVHTSGEGRVLRPDVIVHLPEERDVVVDSKVSLVAYEKYCRAEEDTERDSAAKEFLGSLKAHIKGLEGKKYDELPNLRSLDFVLLFVPIEGAFMLAMQLDQELYRKGFDQGIMLVSPSTLLFVLRTINNLWKTEYQNRNAVEIASQAGGLYDKFVAFAEDLEGIGTQLTRVQKSYDAAHNKLISGKGCLVNRSQTLIDLGVKAKKKLSPAMSQSLNEQTDQIEG